MSTSPRFAIGPDLRAALVAMVRKRVPESEVEDIVQQTLAEAVESPHAPPEGEALRRWIFGVAKNKVVDYHRRAGRESFDLPEVPDSPAPHAEADLLRWAERHLPPGDDAKRTLDWMLREGDGEKLESIAASEKVPAPRVRQRVSRMRRHLKAHWQREVAILAALGVIVGALVLLLRRPAPAPIADDPRAVPIDPRAEQIRGDALARCDAAAKDPGDARATWKECLDGLDEARRLDPAGEARPEVRRARQAADRALAPSPTALPPSPAPSATAPAPSPVPTAPLLPSATPAPTLAPPPAKKPVPPKPIGTSDPFGAVEGVGPEPGFGSITKTQPAKPAPAAVDRKREEMLQQKKMLEENQMLEPKSPVPQKNAAPVLKK